jgi:hypothetical protein
MFFRSAALLAVLLAATVAATPDHVALKGPALQSILAPGSAVRARLLAVLESAGGTATDEYKPPAVDFPAPVLTTIEAAQSAGPAPKPPPDEAPRCATGTVAPEITRIKGELTSQGYMVIEGRCFGPSGNVLLGGFPSTPQVAIQVWTPTAITVQFPRIVGVPDLVMSVTVTHAPAGQAGSIGSLAGQLAGQIGALSSKAIAAKFTAAIGDPVALPSRYIAMNDCGGASPICLAAPPAMAVGVHVDSAPASGADIWTFTIPEHWHLHGVRLVHLSPSAASSSTINGSGAQKTIRVAWSESAIQQHADSTSACSPATLSGLGPFEGPFMQQICAANPVVGILYAANYRIEPIVRGPAGMVP